MYVNRLNTFEGGHMKRNFRQELLKRNIVVDSQSARVCRGRRFFRVLIVLISERKMKQF